MTNASRGKGVLDRFFPLRDVFGKSLSLLIVSFDISFPK